MVADRVFICLEFGRSSLW